MGGMVYSLDVALVQWLPGENPAENAVRMRDLALRANGARLIVFPEYSQFCTKRLGERGPDAAEPIDGQFAQAMSELSDEVDATIVAGMIERDGDTVFNSMLVCAQGAVQHVYRKVHLYDSFGGGESDWLTSGDPDQTVVFEVDGAPIGVQTCYDLRFPEITRRLAVAGAETVLVPADWIPGPLKEQQWRTLAAARAIENTVYIGAPDVAPPLGVGHTTLFDPRGMAIAGVGDETEAVVTGVIESNVIEAVRKNNPSLALRRYDVTVSDRSGNKDLLA